MREKKYKKIREKVGETKREKGRKIEKVKLKTVKVKEKKEIHTNKCVLYSINDPQLH